MKRDLLDLVPRPQHLLRRLRALTVGGALAGLGLVGMAPALDAATNPAAEPTALSPTIVDRSRKAAKLMLKLPGRIGSYMVQHRSHSSHASHASHYSGSSGAATAPPPARVPAPVVTPPVVAAPAVTEAGVADNIMAGVKFDAFDRVTRAIKVKDAVGAVTEFVWRDDTKVGSALNSSRMDDYLESHFNNHPWSVGQPLTITWKPSADGKKRVATAIR